MTGRRLVVATSLTALLLVAVIWGPSAAQPEGEVVVPGGTAFVRAVLGMVRPDPTSAGETDFMVEMARHLSAPLVVDYERRLEELVEELRELRRVLAALEEKYGPVAASLSEPGSPGDQKARELLDFLGFRVREEGGRVQLQRGMGDRDARRRQLLGYLRVSVPVQSRLWAAGEPIELSVRDDRVPLLFGAAAWNEQVFEKEYSGEALFDAFVDDERARAVLAGYASTDRSTRELLFRDVGLRRLYRNRAIATGFIQTAAYLSSSERGLEFPGGDIDAWQAIVGGWSDLPELIEKLVTRDNGRPAHLWRALSLVPEARARYLLTLDRRTADDRARWARDLYGEIRMPDFGQPIRWPSDPAELFVRLRLRGDGTGIDWPGGGRAWLAALEDDDPLGESGELERLLERFAAGNDSGADVDARILRALLDESDPSGARATAIQKFLAVTAAIRYQEIGIVRRAIPLLYRNYDRFGRAYGFFVTPTPLPAGTVESLIYHLQQVDRIERPEARVDALRKLQATLVLLHRLLLNDLLTNDDREALLASFLELPLATGAPGTVEPGGGASREGYGTALTEWWRVGLIPALARGLRAQGWPGDPTNLRTVLVTALIGRIDASPIEVDGIDYSFQPASTHGRRMHLHLLQQEQPSFERLFRLDEIAAELEAAPEASALASLAAEIDTIVDELQQQMPPNIGDEEVNAALPVAVARSKLFESSAALAVELRTGRPSPDTVRSFRGSVSAYIGDALVGIAYAMHMGDPGSFTYQQGHIAWLHRLVIAEISDGAPELLFGPWAPTAESFIQDEGSRMHNSLFGAPDTLGRWNLENAMPPGGARDPAAAEHWGSTLAYLHLPSITVDSQRLISRRHALATSWIQAAVDARDPELPPPFWASVDSRKQPPALASTLRLLLRANELERFRDAVSAGSERRALALVSPGNRYLLLRMLDNNDAAAPASARWLLDQMVGMPVGRHGDYLGLATPEPVPHGEAGDNLADALLYTRLFDIRVRLAVLMQQLQLPANMHPRLLIEAMGRVLASMRPSPTDPWRGILDAIEREVTDVAIKQWIVDLAFNDELVADDPALALERARGAAGDTGPSLGTPSGPRGGLSLPQPAGQYQATFGAEVNVVTVDVGVWDDDGNFVADLTIEDFGITHEGQPVTPTFMRLEGSAKPSIFLDDLPEDVAEKVTARARNVVLVADLLTTAPQDWDRLLLDVTEFVRAGVDVEDRLALVTIDRRGVPAVLNDFTIDHERVAENLEAQMGNAFEAGDLERSFIDLTRTLCDNSMCFSPDGDEDACQAQLSGRFSNCITASPDWEDMKMQLAIGQLGRWAAEEQDKARRLIAALTQVGGMLDVGDPLDRQKTLVLLSSGFERQPGTIHYQTLVEYASFSDSLNPMEIRRLRNDVGNQIASLTDVMRKCRCTIYSIGTLGQARFAETSLELNASPVVSRFAARSALQDPLNALSRDTGGKPFFGTDTGLGFRDVLEDTRLRYVLGFLMEETVEPGADPRWHDLDVQVNRRGVEVRAREGFFWPRR